MDQAVGRLRPRVVKVLSGPIDGSRHGNAYIRLLLGGLDDAVALEGFTWRRALLGRHDVIHLHWIEHMLDNTGTGRRTWPKLAVLAVVVAKAKVLGTKLVWTIHNDRPHEQPRRPVRIGLALWHHATDAAVFLTEAGRERHTGRPFPATAVIRLGHYRPTMAEVAPQTRARPYLLSFGLLRAYKGLDRLVTAARNGCVDVVIAGPDNDGAQAAALRGLAGGSSRVEIDARYLPDDELESLVRGALGVVLPYRQMNNSSALLLALTAGTRCLVPDTPTNREVSDLVGPGWITRFQGDLDAEDLNRFASAGRPDSDPDLSAFDWDRVIGGHVELYRRITA